MTNVHVPTNGDIMRAALTVLAERGPITLPAARAETEHVFVVVEHHADGSKTLRQGDPTELDPTEFLDLIDTALRMKAAQREQQGKPRGLFEPQAYREERIPAPPIQTSGPVRAWTPPPLT